MRIIQKKADTIRRQGAMTVLLISLLVFSLQAGAQISSTPSGLTATESELKEYFQNKYRGQISEVRVSNYDGVTYPVATRVNITGLLTPPGVAGLGTDKLKNAWAIADAFVTEEGALLGRTALSELRIAPPHPLYSDRVDERGYFGFTYHHYLNGIKLDPVEIGTGISPDGQITGIGFYIVPISPELLAAVQMPHLSEKAIRRLIKKDLIAYGENWKQVTGLRRKEKLAIPIPPYLIWKVEVIGEKTTPWEYTINAFTGAIMEKRDMRQY